MIAAPGWMPLLILCYLALPFAGLPTSIQFRGRSVELSQELCAGVVALVLFLVGDALDKSIYKRLDVRVSPHSLAAAKQAARSTLHIHDGLYEVVKALATSAGLFQTFSIQFLNETAKFLRSLALPTFVVGIGLAVNGHALPGVALVVTTAMLIPFYARLKATHICHLYELAPLLKADKQCRVEELGAVRMFFWDGILVGSALSSNPRRAQHAA
jgi:hypothetical protein